MRKILIFLLVLMAGCSSTTELKILPELPYEKRQIIAVLDFENKTGNQAYNTVLSGLCDSVIEELLTYGRFRVVERERLDDILSEFKLEMTGFVDDKYVKELGKHLGVDALLFGSLKSVTHNENKNHAGLAYTVKRNTEVVLSARLVSVETNEIISSSTVVSGVTQREAVALGFVRSGNITDEETVIRSAIDSAISRLVNEITERTPAKS